MTKIVGKGCALQIEIASTFTDIAQLTSIDLPEAETETYESDTLDNTSVGIPYEPTGRTEGGSVGFEGFLDPVGTTYKTLTGILEDPEGNNDTSYKIVFSDSASTEWPFDGAGLTLGGSVALSDGVRFTGSVKLDGIVDYPDA